MRFRFFFSKYLIILFLGLFVSCKVFGQNSLFRAPEFNVRRGFVMPHHKSVQYLAKGFVTSAEVSVGFRSDTSEMWQKVHKSPVIGAGLMFSDLNNPQVLGKAYSIFLYIRHTIFSRKRFSVNYKFAEGIAYLTEHFEPENNVVNMVIGSHFNIHIFVGLEAEMNLSERIKFVPGIGLTHYSNGAIKIPNKGINLVGISAGLILDKKRVLNIDKSHILSFKSRKYYSVIVSAGIHQLNDWGKKEYLIGSISVEYSKQTSPKFARGFGCDLFYDSALKTRTLSDSITLSKKKDYLYPGIHISGDYIFGNVSFTMQFGSYLLWRPYSYQYVYSRFGLRYKLRKHLLANITLKTYFSAADFIEFGMGYYFEKN